MAIVSYVLFKLNWSSEFEWIWATSSMMRAVNQVGIDRSDRPRWIYSILGRGQLEGVLSEDVIVWVDALTNEPTEAPGKTRIYRGLVAGFTTDEKGSLRDLIVTAARRSKFREVDGRFEFAWQKITPGDYFLIRYSEIKNLNITYRSADDPIPAEEFEFQNAAATASCGPETSAPADRTSPAS